MTEWDAGEGPALRPLGRVNTFSIVCTNSLGQFQAQLCLPGKKKTDIRICPQKSVPPDTDNADGALRHNDLRDFCPEEVSTLQAYDKETGSELLKTLERFLLYMDRCQQPEHSPQHPSLPHHKIKELIGADLKAVTSGCASSSI